MFDFSYEALYRIPALLIALTVHEYAHAVVADSMGDPTPRYMGRLTMNPLVHLDPFGTLALFLVGFGWAKPVPVNPSYFRDGRKGMMAVSFAGPGSNLLIAFIGVVLFAVMVKFQLLGVGVLKFLIWLQLYNIWFALFNLMPIPPLDGSKILMSMLPGRQAYALMQIEPYSQFILIGLIVFGVTGMVLSPIASFLLGGMKMFVGIFI